MTPILLRFNRLNPASRLPTKAREHDAGWDLYTPAPFEVHPGGTARINLGIAWECPPGWYAQVVGRSSLASLGIAILGGCIDGMYRGPWGVMLANLGVLPVTFNTGDRIAQFVLLPVPPAEVIEVDELGDSDRGAGGWGSSGK